MAECIRQKAELVQPQPEDLNLPEQSEPLTNPFSYGGYEVELPFLGAHQSCNAAMAVEIALACGARVTKFPTKPSERAGDRSLPGPH